MNQPLNPANLRKTHGSGYKAGRPVVHYTAAPASAGYGDRIKPICGQRSNKAHYGIYPDTAIVNCEKCLAAVQAPTSQD